LFTILRRALFAAFALHAGLAAALTLPSVPIGGRLLVDGVGGALTLQRNTPF